MKKHTHQAGGRRGAVIVETALILMVLMMLLYGIFEYGRFVMLEQLLVNAAREGGRYAIVHNRDDNIDQAVRDEVVRRLGNQHGQLQGLDVDVFPTNDPSASVTTAEPDDPITVRVSGNLRTLFGSLLFLPNTIPLRSSVVVTCEGD